MKTEFASRYDPKAAEERWYQFWQDSGFFHVEPPGPGTSDGPDPFTIVIPPPNVTGALHMGHALNNTLQDILIRWRRMQGRNTLWVPGTDHAGIATQAVVEKRIREQEGKTRHDLGRDELVRRIWAWKDEYERRILNQLRKLGSSCDWQRTRFTLDAQCARAVRETFFKMFKDGLIYRGKRLVNWDTHLQTSVADDETYPEEVKGGFWTFRYPVKGSNEFVRFSTTRPETMLGDTAVAVHPNDPRYKLLIGKTVTVPLAQREIPIIADGLLVDPELGTGCVKVTPAHDSNDYACWLRKQGKPDQIDIINILNPDGTINESGGKYCGLDRYKARDAVTADMEALGLFEQREDRVIPLKFSDRSKTPIEPLLSDQWFVRMAYPVPSSNLGLADLAMQAVTDGRVCVHPDRYARSYLDWLGEKRDWCISRQLWWGHRIPVWTKVIGRAADTSDRDSNPNAAPQASAELTFLNADERGQDRIWVHERIDTETNTRLQLVCIRDERDHAIASKLEREGYVQDPDVLDTWFSSALWPHSTLGWPDETPDLKFYYPTSVLVTSRDIITLWVARMVMTGLYNAGDVPFRDVYITPKILDGFGQTMSKSKGNGVDPLDIIEKYGADALRFGIAFMTTDSQDARLPVGYECPSCQTYIAQKIEHQQMKAKDGKKPRIKCPGCKKDFQFSSPNFDPDPGEPVARVVSDRFEQGRNFANKLWNAARFCLMNLEDTPDARTAHAPATAFADEERWILSRLADTAGRATDHLENFRFSEYTKALYDFTWSEFCSWYVEMAKLRLRDPSSRATAQRVLATVLSAITRLLHPIMPFLTEHIWQALGETAPTCSLEEIDKSSGAAAAPSVMIATWPVVATRWQDRSVEARMERLQSVIRSIRNIRSNFNVDEKARVSVHVRCSAELGLELSSARQFIEQLASVDAFVAGPGVAKPAESASAVGADWELYVPLTGLIDRNAEIERNRKQLQAAETQLKGYQAKLNNSDFISKAPRDVVEMHQQRAAELQAQISSIGQILRELGGAA